MAGGPPRIDVGDDSGFRHRLWRIEQQRIQGELNQILKPLTFYIADGHHRFRTAVRFMQECEEKGWSPGGVESFDKRMMALFNMESPGTQNPGHSSSAERPGRFQFERILDCPGF